MPPRHLPVHWLNPSALDMSLLAACLCQQIAIQHLRTRGITPPRATHHKTTAVHDAGHMKHIPANSTTCIGRLTFSGKTAAPPPERLDLLCVAAARRWKRRLCNPSAVAGWDRSRRSVLQQEQHMWQGCTDDISRSHVVASPCKQLFTNKPC